jgi:energy-coupling factor transport system ATP-binding protein
MPIEVKSLTHIYMPGTPFEAKALNDISLSIHDGEFIGIIGHTGSGKSTLISHLNGLEHSEPGVVFVNGIDLGEKGSDLIAIRRVVGLVFQYPEYQLFEETVAKDVAFGPNNLGLDAAEIERRVETALKQVGLNPAEVSEKSPFELSGGQKRRVAIAGVLAMQPSTLILDEPAAGLDPAGRREMFDLIRGIHDSGVTVVMVSHSMDDVGRLCDRLFVLNKGEIAYSGTPAEVFLHESKLHAIGLDVPEGAKLARRLRDAGFDMPQDIYRTEDVCAAIIANLRGASDDKC